MRTRTRHTAAQVGAAVAVAFVLLCAESSSASAAATSVSPLPPSDYTARAVCPAPAPGQASCQAFQLVAATAGARAHTHPLGVASAVAQTAPSPAAGDFGLRPQDLHDAYQLPLDDETSPVQTIAIVDSYNDLAAEEDLHTYDEEFDLPECTTANGCFHKVNEHGQTTNLPFPQSAPELESARVGSSKEREQAAQATAWALEISLDIETSHAICQNCRIALVEANSPSYTDLEAAEESAVALGAGEVSNSWSGPECIDGECVNDEPAFDHPGIVIAASAGDDGFLNWLGEPGSANYPAASPNVLAVGGTRLEIGPSGEWEGETVWNDGGFSEGSPDGYGAGGGGCSVRFAAPPWQLSTADWSAVGCADRRAVADVAADADPYTGLAVYDSGSACTTSYEQAKVKHVVHWCTIGGTSLSSPLIAAVFGLAGGAQGVKYPARTLYENEAASPSSLHDVTAGSNGECASPFDEEAGAPTCTSAEQAAASCSSDAVCLARSGYDGPTGVGTPDGLAAFQPLDGGEGPQPTSGEETGIGKTGGGAGGGEGGPAAPGAGTEPGPGTPHIYTGARAGAAATGGSVRLTGVALTAHAVIALNTSRPRIRQLAFSFAINLAARVRVSLAKRVRAHGHTRWQQRGRPLMLSAFSGRNTDRLQGRGVLSPGVYRLLLAPRHGAARALVFTIG
jgi:Subtilase family